jgi:hypothetical protein
MTKREAFLQSHKLKMRAVYRQALRVYARSDKENQAEEQKLDCYEQKAAFAVGDTVKVTKLGSQMGEQSMSTVREFSTMVPDG